MFKICLCGGSDRYGHTKDCPWPQYDIYDDEQVIAWEEGRGRMKKPQPKCEAVVTFHDKSYHLIVIQASQDAIEDFKEFGNMYPEGPRHHLFVDARYDFDEVLEYIQNYDSEDK